MKKGGLIACVLVLALVLDLALAASGWIQSSGYFWLDDFELTQARPPGGGLGQGHLRLQRAHQRLPRGPERERLRQHGHGLRHHNRPRRDTRGRAYKVGSELVLALNWGALSDIMDTNPTYEWHRKWYEPYFYFQRDRIAGFINDTFKALIRGGEFRTGPTSTQTKAYYYGHMSRRGAGRARGQAPRALPHRRHRRLPAEPGGAERGVRLLRGKRHPRARALAAGEPGGGARPAWTSRCARPRARSVRARGWSSTT